MIKDSDKNKTCCVHFQKLLPQQTDHMYQYVHMAHKQKYGSIKTSLSMKAFAN